MKHNSVLSICFLILGLSASMVEGGECSGGNFHCNWLGEQCSSAEWSAWCTPNENKVDSFEPDCEGTVYCHQLSANQCNKAPKEDSYGGCTYTNRSSAVGTATVALASVAVLLLLVTIFLLVRLTRAKKIEGGVEVGAITEPLLEGGADA